MNLLKAYKLLCEERSWVPDRAHQSTLTHLQETYTEFSHNRRWYNRWRTPSNSPEGIYVWGSVGRGKTFLMDLFFDEVDLKHKARWHFTEFMQLVHQLLADFSHSQSKPLDAKNAKTQPIVLVAKYLSKHYQLICLDEFQVTEIGDAMVLSRLFNQLIENHVFIIVTSNKSPTDLYRGGLHYDRFFSFVELIQSKWQVLHLENEADQDYRRHKDPTKDSDLKDIYDLQIKFQEIVQKEGHESGDFLVYKRRITFPHATPTTLWVDFADVCEQAYGAAEYHAIAQFYKIVFLVGVPQMGPHNRDEAQRFIILIDCLYDNNVLLYLQSHYPPDHLYTEKGPQCLPFERTASRLTQMLGQSEN